MKCYNLLFRPVSLERCGHTFCTHCFYEFMKKQNANVITCPVPGCQCFVRSRPVPNLAVTQLITMVEAGLPIEQKLVRNIYKEMILSSESDAAKRYSMQAEVKKLNGVKFMDILQDWPDHLRIGFIHYLSNTYGELRKSVCKSVGFSTELVKSATQEQLFTMYKNLDMILPQYVMYSENNTLCDDFELGRSKLIQFLE